MSSPVIAPAASCAERAIRNGATGAGGEAAAGAAAGSVAGAGGGPSSCGCSRSQPPSSGSKRSSNGSASRIESGAARSADHMQTQPLRDERGLLFVLDLDRDVDLHDHVARLALLDAQQFDPRADPLADLHRRGEADLVETVVHDELRV